MRTLLERAFRIEEGEGRAVGLSLLQAIFLGLPRLFTLTVGAALFLERYAADNIPYVYIAASVVLPLAGLLHLSIGRRVSFLRMQLGTLLVLAAVPAGFLFLLRSTSAAWPAFALFVWCGAELHLANIVLWSTANRTFTVRQGKRLFGLIGAGEIVGAIAGGAALPSLARLVGTVELLWVSVAGFLLTFLGLAVTARVSRNRLAQGPDRRSAAAPGGHELLGFLRERFLLLIFLTYSLVLSAGFFVNSIFYFQVRETFPSAAGVAIFLARFTAVSAFLSLAFRTFLSSRFLLRFGLVGGLVSTPAALLGAALFVLYVGRGGIPSPELFWGVVSMRLLERLLLGALGQPAYYSLYQPLSRERRARIQTAAETIAGPIVGGVTGAYLLFLTKGLSLTAVGLTAAFLPVLLVWLGVGVAVGRAFPGALTTALRRRGVTGGDLTVSDQTSLLILERGLESPRPAEVLHCLRLLEEAEHPRLPELLRTLADHADPVVRGAVYGAIERTAGPEWVSFLASRVDREGEDSRGALFRAMGASGRLDARSLLEPVFEASKGVARRGALVALIRYADAGDGHPAARELDRLVRSEDAGERVEAARALGEIGSTSAMDGLATLLDDGDLAVRRAALDSARCVGVPGILGRAVPSLEVPGVRAEAIRALLAFPEAASGPLIDAYQATGSSRSLRRVILQVLGRSRDLAAMRFLVGELAFSERQVLSDVLWALHLFGFRAAGPDRKLVESCFHAEVRRGSFLVSARHDLRNEPGTELLVSSLGQELARTQKKIFLLLSFVLDSEAMLRIWSNFSVSPALRDLSLELFEARVDRTHAKCALPVLAEVNGEASVAPLEQLRRILFVTRPRAGAWLRACAVDALGAQEEALSDAERNALLADDEELVRETARGRWTEATGPRRSRQIVDRVRVLRGVSIFREIDDEILAELAPRLEEVWAGEGEEVECGGTRGRSMFVVSEGSLRFEARGEIASRLLPGQIFGELSALGSEVAPERVTALEPSHLFRLSDADLRDFMSMRIEVVRGIIGVLCQRARSVSAARAAMPDGERAHPGDVAAKAAWVVYGEALSPLDRVLILKTAEIFAEVSDDVLAEVAGRTREVRLRKNELLFRKGDPGTTTYIVAAGRLRIHVDDRLIAEVGERAVVGELAALSSEPRTASVTAADDSLLLTLDQESLFDLMLDQQEIARGIIRVLVGRLRAIHGAPRA